MDRAVPDGRSGPADRPDHRRWRAIRQPDEPVRSPATHPATDVTDITSGRWDASHCRPGGAAHRPAGKVAQRPRVALQISTGRAGAPSTGAGSSGVAAMPPAAIRSRVASPASSIVPNTV